jgi:hypothetical protein
MRSLLLLDHDPRSRLGWLDALRRDFEVAVIQRGELPVRRVRSLRPEVVIMTVPRGRLQETLRWSRTIKTDSTSPPPVGLVDPAGRIRSQAQALELSMADGLLRGEAPPVARQQFVEALIQGAVGTVLEYPVRGWRGRLLSRG